jgi:ribosomal protein L11 methyltransferase
VSWRATLPCTRAQAEALPEADDLFAHSASPPVLVADEPDPAKPDEWLLHAYFEHEPAADELGLLASLADGPPQVQQLGDEDWVTRSQAGLEPIRAGRFHVHTPSHPPQDGAINFEIDAGLAFGTGQHATTKGCLEALDRLERGGKRYANIADIGTGTGLLAFAALKLWPGAQVAASDIDPVSIEVTEENAAINAIPLGAGAGEVELAVAPGMEHHRLQARAPYDLIIANILAGPLVELAPSVGASLAAGGRLMLAGLLDTQAETVAAAYRRQGLMGGFSIPRGDWPTLVMRKRKALGWR